MIKYEKPTIVDYGTLLELTLMQGSPNRDMPTGDANTSWPNPS